VHEAGNIVAAPDEPHRTAAIARAGSLPRSDIMASNLSRVQLQLPVGARDHVQGRADAPLTLVEYGDFESPACAEAYPIVRDLQRRLDDRLRFVFRHFPLTEAHPHAQRGAEAAEEAGAQGHFWEMHDLLFEESGPPDDAQLRRCARLVGLDMAAFERALATHRHAERVGEDVLSGLRSGASGTPTFFINGARYEGPVEVDALLEAIFLAERLFVANTSF
jgi:protein-disulfide isomerase